jgi:hypothetical protein
MKYKALILDLDGTTVANDIEALPSARVTQAIQKAKEYVHVSIATSRPFYKAQAILDILQLSSPCVFSGGAQLYNPVSKQCLTEHYLNHISIPSIVSIAKKFNLPIGMSNGVEDALFVDDAVFKKIFGMYFPVIPPGLTQTVEEELQMIEGISIHKMPSWEKGYESIDVTDIHATKFHGISEMMHMMGIQKEEVIGVGDSSTDISLLLASGLKVAMGNAVPELKEIADFVAPSVEDDGVATVIENFILSPSVHEGGIF